MKETSLPETLSDVEEVESIGSNPAFQQKQNELYKSVKEERKSLRDQLCIKKSKD